MSFRCCGYFLVAVGFLLFGVSEGVFAKDCRQIIQQWQQEWRELRAPKGDMTDYDFDLLRHAFLIEGIPDESRNFGAYLHGLVSRADVPVSPYLQRYRENWFKALDQWQKDSNADIYQLARLSLHASFILDREINWEAAPNPKPFDPMMETIVIEGFLRQKVLDEPPFSAPPSTEQILFDPLADGKGDFKIDREGRSRWVAVSNLFPTHTHYGLIMKPSTGVVAVRELNINPLFLNALGVPETAEQADGRLMSNSRFTFHDILHSRFRAHNHSAYLGGRTDEEILQYGLSEWRFGNARARFVDTHLGGNAWLAAEFIALEMDHERTTPKTLAAWQNAFSREPQPPKQVLSLHPNHVTFSLRNRLREGDFGLLDHGDLRAASQFYLDFLEQMRGISAPATP